MQISEHDQQQWSLVLADAITCGDLTRQVTYWFDSQSVAWRVEFLARSYGYRTAELPQRADGKYGISLSPIPH